MADVVEFFYGDPDCDLVRVARGKVALAGSQTGSAAEAVTAGAAACDYVVVQGTEAGAHARGTQRLNEVLGETLADIEIPVVAAGRRGHSTASRLTA